MLPQKDHWLQCRRQPRFANHSRGAAAQVSTVLGVVIEEQREEKAWTEGVAIWAAVMVVSLVGPHPCWQSVPWMFEQH